MTIHLTCLFAVPAVEISSNFNRPLSSGGVGSGCVGGSGEPEAWEVGGALVFQSVETSRGPRQPKNKTITFLSLADALFIVLQSFCNPLVGLDHAVSKP